MSSSTICYDKEQLKSIIQNALPDESSQLKQYVYANLADDISEITGDTCETTKTLFREIFTFAEQYKKYK